MQLLKRAQKATKLLSIVTPAATVLSVICVTVSMFTNCWLLTSEQIYFRSFAPKIAGKDALARLKETVSGLWTICVTDNMINATVSTETTHTDCFFINYFGKDNYTDENDGDDSTMAIPYTVIRSGPIFFIGYLLLGAGVTFSILGYILRRFRIVVFISGISSIIAGLVLFIGVVVYLSILQMEVGQKLRPPNAMDRSPFIYTYGYGIILMAIGSIFTEIMGTCVTLWYIHWHQLDWAEKTKTRTRNSGSYSKDDQSEGEGHSHVYCISGCSNTNTNIVGPENPDCPTHRYGYSLNGSEIPSHSRLTPIIECPASSRTHVGPDYGHIYSHGHGHGRKYRYSSEKDNFWEAGGDHEGMGDRGGGQIKGRGIVYDLDRRVNDSDNDQDFEIPAPPPPPMVRYYYAA